MKKLKLRDLNDLYLEAEQVDKDVFAEQRSNILLVAGEHYNKKATRVYTKLRDYSRIAEQARLRLTKNHVHKIVRYYEHQITSKAPGVSAQPKNEAELQDKKSAELNQAVWNDAKERHKLNMRIRKWVQDFVQIGEVACKIYWDPTKGDFLGYEPRMSLDGEDYVYDDEGNTVDDESRPIFSGDFCFETIPCYDLLRSRSALSMDESPYLIFRKMVDKKDLEKAYESEPEKLKGLQDDNSKTSFIVFDQNAQAYTQQDKRVLIKEYYFKPCMEYPNGYFYIATEFAVLEEGELPFGIFPIAYKGFDEYSGSARGRSIIKVARPFQAEINRASSQLAMHQITVGDDKVLYQSGTKLAMGALLPGVRGISYQGAPPTVLAGRDGGQYIGYIDNQIKEMYSAVMLSETLQDDKEQGDPYTLLFRSMKDQIKFSKYAEKFGEFLTDVCTLYLELAKQYLPDDRLIGAVGRSEYINIPEFRNTTPLEYQIVLDEQTDAIDTQLGKQLTLTHVLQYVGKQLDEDQIGQVMRNMPFVNNEDIFSGLTIDHDNVENDMLALERGEIVDVSPYANNEYYVKKLTHRQKQADFKYLDPMIQQNYMNLLMLHEQEIARKQQEIIDAKNEYIPMGGSMVKVDMYVDKEDGKGSERLQLPTQAINWLNNMLKKQNVGMEKLTALPTGAQAELAAMVNQQNAPMAQPGMGALPGVGGLPPGIV